MLPEISLNVLDIAQNSISAQARHLQIRVIINQEKDRLRLEIEDDGRGMTQEELQQVCDPFFTTRTTRKVGLGVPFLKQAAEVTEGAFSIQSEVGVGTVIVAEFCLDHIDCMPLGDICGVIHSLVIMNEEIEIVFTYRVKDKEFVLDTGELKEILGEVSFNEPEVSKFIYEFLEENKAEVER